MGSSPDEATAVSEEFRVGFHEEMDQLREELARRHGGESGVQHVGRNDPCPCGSGKKHKKCCGA